MLKMHLNVTLSALSIWPGLHVYQLLIFFVAFCSKVKACDSLQILGGIEPSLYRGEIWYTPIVEEWYYQVEVLKLEVGGQPLDLDCREASIMRNSYLTFLSVFVICEQEFQESGKMLVNR